MKRLANFWNSMGIGTSLLCAIMILLLLQIWRPCFFLTDDSFSLAFPILVSVGYQVWNGLNPFVSPYLFGGDYPSYRDSALIILWHPFNFSVALLSQTFLRNILVDLIASANVLMAVAGFRWLLIKWNEDGLVRISAGQAVFVSLSYAFSMYALLLGSSGLWYLANLAALPWLVGAWWERDARKMGVIVILAAFHNAVGGYPSCFLYSMGIIACIGLWKSFLEKDFRRLMHYSGALVIGGLLCFPFMAPSLYSLGESTRSVAIPVELASEHRMPVLVQLTSVFLGSGSMVFGEFVLFGKVVHAYALASFAASGLALAACWRGKGLWNFWDLGLLLSMTFLVLLVSRPDWLGGLLQKVPVLGSLRWPHKEVYLLVFFLHLWAARGTGLGQKKANLMCFAGILIFLVSLVPAGPPSLNEHQKSRQLFLSGQADEYWLRIKSGLTGDEQVIPVIPDDLAGDLARYFEVPLILTGGGNFPAAYGVRSWSGYSATMPQEIFKREPQPVNVVGLFKNQDKEELSAVPGGVFLEVVNEKPLKIVIERPGGEEKTVWGD